MFSAQTQAPEPRVSISDKPKLPILKVVASVLSMLVLIASIFVCCRACYLIVTTCSNALGTDFVHAMPFIDSGLSKGLDPSIPFARDIHSLVIPRLMHLMNACFFGWDARIELLICFALIVVRTFFTFGCLRLRNSKGAQIMLFSVICLVNFGTCNSSILFSGQPATSFGLSSLFLVLGLWGWAQLPPRLALVLLAICGALSSYCLANWPACWVAFFLVAILSKTDLKKLTLVSIGTIVLSMPVVVNMCIQRVGTNDGADRSNVLAIVEAFVNTIGRPFCNDTAAKFSSLPMSHLAGWEGLAFLVILLLLNRRRISESKQLQCAVALIVYGILSSLITSLSRGYITAWYVMFGCHFWIGLAALAIVLIDESGFAPALVSSGSGRKVGVAFGCIFLCVFAINYLRSNISYKDKDWYRRTHTPSSEACLRDYRMLPTYAEQFLFAGEVGDLERVTRLAVPLEKHRLSAFSRKYEQSLQGDFVLPTVVSREICGSDETQWVAPGRPKKKLSWQDAEHLCLKLDARNSMTWNVSLQPDTTCATIRTSVRGIPEVLGQPMTAQVRLSSRGQFGKIYECIPISVSSTNSKSVSIPIRKRTEHLTIEFTGQGNTRGCLLFDYPTVLVERGSVVNSGPVAETKLIPSNTELSHYYPIYSSDDLILPPSDRLNWSFADLKVLEAKKGGPLSFETQGRKPTLTLLCGLNVSAQEFTHFCFTLSGTKALSKPRVACIEFVINGSVLRPVLLPLLPDDDAPHNYSYDLKLLELGKNERITGLCLLPVYLRSPSEVNQLVLDNVRFVKKHAQSDD